MKKMTLDEINFVRTKVQLFAELPKSPKGKKDQTSKRNISIHSYNSPKNQNSSKNQKSNQVKNKTQQKRAWLILKQIEIKNYLARQNRDRNSVLFEYLNSDKIHLKKIEDTQPPKQQIKPQQQQVVQEKQLSQHSEAFSFDKTFSSLTKVYKNMPNLLGTIEYQTKKKQQDNAQKSNNALFNLFSKLGQKKQQQSKQVKVEKFDILTDETPIKPSMMKGKNHMFSNSIQPRKQVDNNNSFFKKSTNSIPRTRVDHHAGKNIQKQLSQKSDNLRNKSSSFSNIKKEKQYSIHQKSAKKLDNSINTISRNSFVSDNQSAIKQSQNFIKQLKKVQFKMNNYKKREPNIQKKALSPSRQPQTYNSKKNRYQLSRQTKFLIQKYATKQESPQQKYGLKNKYENLEKRLQRILQTVKQQKQHSIANLNQDNIRCQKKQISDQIITYQKLSPLKKLLKVNKQRQTQYSNLMKK